ncbi:MAG TPA: hypothetical protein VLL05_02260 [Terriglobales bacterium]|nr:hypothetical protein [Terriglobales bacterium]
MYLAGILALCALLHVSAFGYVRGGLSSSGIATLYSFVERRNQEPTKPDTQPDSSQQSPPKQENTPTEQQAQPPQDQPTQPPDTKNPAETPAATQPSTSAPKPVPPAKKSSIKKKHSSKAADDEPQKRVIHRGGTVEPTTQLTSGTTEEQAAKQRQSTNQLLATTDASLQKLSGRQLTKDEQDTVAQIRRFMQQAKAADTTGDLQRAYKLAVKARLLSDALVKP